MTYEQATNLPIGRVVELVVQRYDKEMGNHLTALYSRVKGQWFIAKRTVNNRLPDLWSYELFGGTYCVVMYTENIRLLPSQQSDNKVSMLFGGFDMKCFEYFLRFQF